MRFTCGYASNAALANDLESLREAELDLLINHTGGEQVVVAAPDFLHHAHRVLKRAGVTSSLLPVRRTTTASIGWRRFARLASMPTLSIRAISRERQRRQCHLPC